MCSCARACFSDEFPVHSSFSSFSEKHIDKIGENAMMIPTIRAIVVLLFIVDFDAVAANTVTSAKEECRKRIAECMMNGGGSMPMCGSDGITYSNQCQVISKQCQGMSVLIKHSGPCPETPACLSARLIARPGVRPACQNDGTYMPVQCHAETGYCWCVTPQGRPLPDTTVRYKKPRCLRSGSRSAASIRSGQRRRSPQPWKHRPYVGSNRQRNTCDRTEKSKFNANLIENFKIEYRRTNISAEDVKNVERVLSWKFLMLDQNADGYLDKEEYKELRRLAKKAVRPKKCARTFARTCDLNRDLKLSKQEWGACLANDFTLRLFLSLNPADERPEVSEAQRTRATDQGESQSCIFPVFFPNTVIIRCEYSRRNSMESVTPDIGTYLVDRTNDCISDRRSVLEDQKPKQNIYIPQCMSDGRYHRVQCYSGYCWCVYQDTGKPIPGTSSKDRSPNCNPAPTPSRPMKGCPELKKQLFLRDLMDLMQEKMETSSNNSNETTVKWEASKEERIATWHFVMLDKNKNKVLERKEWKSFRTMVANNKQLRRCGKKLPKYCDINNDRRISMTEWLSCLNAQRPTTVDDPAKTSITPKRIGPNPLDRFLNDDD
ncbi:SPARC-related modular calcium-binding protein 2 [Pogonomyrmex barbatus]|uniref:SPARC-related modular calcium-binding protein 2 n=1 Tax=Pogonomyrmex barbatus TaxID=144034 RepID=A0A6I9W7B6_9HYME|nr:SPARC-related modular calcium-binding protein 2 [Pogonomyrmex barbatus]